MAFSQGLLTLQASKSMEVGAWSGFGAVQIQVLLTLGSITELNQIMQ